MLTIEEIVSALNTSRSDFTRIFEQVQERFGIRNSMKFETIALSALDKEAFTKALEYADDNGWLDYLLDEIVENRLENGQITHALLHDAALKNPGNAELQAMANPQAGFGQPYLISRGIAESMRWTTKIIIDAAERGTGILIGAHLVLTAWHVVEKLFEKNGSGKWQPIPNSSSRLQIKFDDFFAIIGRNTGLRPVGAVTVEAHQDWCVAFCICHEEEIQHKLPADRKQLKGFWDYAVIKLAKAPGIERRWAKIDSRYTVPKTDEPIFIIQHPDGKPLQQDQSVIVDAAPPIPEVIPDYRFLHTVNALPGSSGGPCFDVKFSLFGLHQGVWSKINAKTINRGIPITRILEHIKAEYNELPSLDPSDSPFWNLERNNTSTPVIGCDSFQSKVWSSVTQGKPKLISITGAKKSGKTFRVGLLDAMLSNGSHLKIKLSAASFSKMDLESLINLICTTAGAPTPAVVKPEKPEVTLNTWLGSEVIPDVIRAIDSIRDDRLVWLLLTDLNEAEIEDKTSSDFLFLLYEQLLVVEWMRIVLDGMRGDISSILFDITEAHRVSPLTSDDLKIYFQRFFINKTNLSHEIVDFMAASSALQLIGKYEKALDNGKLEVATRNLLTEIKDWTKTYLQVANT